MASIKRIEHKSGRIVYRIVICLGYDKRGNKLVKNLTYPVSQTATPQQALMFLKSLNLSYETVYIGHQRIDDTGKPYYVNDHTESHKVDTQYKVFYTLSLYCGFRKGETLAIHWDDIDFEKREISISKSVGKAETGVGYKKPKTKTSIRSVTFPEQIIPLLKQYRTEYNLLRLRLGSA